MEIVYPENLGGPFEIHTVVDLADEPLLQQWILDPTHTVNLVTPKLTGFCAFYGEHQIHLMLSAFFVGTVEGAVARTKEITDSFALNRIRILRVKIESGLHVRNVPQHIESEHEYYEVHIKVPVVTIQQWNRLAIVSRTYEGHLFLNNRSKTAGLHAIITVRTYKTKLEDFEKQISALKEAVVSEGFTIASTRAEYSFYDTNTMLDKGWLFK